MLIFYTYTNEAAAIWIQTINFNTVDLNFFMLVIISLKPNIFFILLEYKQRNIVNIIVKSFTYFQKIIFQFELQQICSRKWNILT